MSFASRLGYENRDPKLKVVEPPVVRAPIKPQGTDLAIVARLQAELKTANARIAELEAANKELTERLNARPSVNNVNEPVKQDRKAYMREYMRKKRAKTAS